MLSYIVFATLFWLWFIKQAVVLLPAPQDNPWYIGPDDTLADQTKKIAMREGGRKKITQVPGVGFIRTTVTRSEATGQTYVTKEVL